MQRLFTLDEARRLLPRVRDLAQELRDTKEQFDRHRAAFDLLAGRTEGEGAQARDAMQRHGEEAERLAGRLQAIADEVHGLGVEIKGVADGLLDFPAEREGRIVYLCWKLDEPDIAYWHDLDTGFGGRQPL